MSEELGRGGRLVGGAAPELVEAAYAYESGHGPRLAHGLSLADLAHAVALIEGGGLAGPEAAALCRGLLELHGIPGAEFPWNPELGDAFNSREAELTRRVGAAAAGWLSAGRPRREAFRVGLRLTARAGVLDTHSALLELATALVGLASDHRDDLAADYTYLQPAQPTTAGHLLLAYAYPALRDAARLRRLHGELGLSVAGAGGSAGSRWPLDRELLAGLLGCDGLITHAKDAAWQADVYVEVLAALAIAATHLSQLGQDFEIYASQEFSLISLPDELSRASALMPQKRNPYALAAIRAQAGQAAGDLAAALTVLHTGSARTDHFHLLNGLVPRALEEAARIAGLAAAVAGGLELNLARMGAAARDGFTSMADVADVLAQHAGIDYRSAHKSVGRAVRTLMERDESPHALTPELLSESVELVTGSPALLPAEVLIAALDPAADAEARVQAGSSSQAAISAMLAECRALIGIGVVFSDTAYEAASAAEDALLARARVLASAP